MLSYWEKEQFIHYQYIIIGGGIVGFSTAISLKELKPKASVLVLDSGFLPTGASTKNAGFACVGSLSELVDDLQSHTEQEVQELAQLRFEGLQLLKKRLGENRIDYKASGSYELLFEHEMALLNDMDRINHLLQPIFGKNIFSEDAKSLQTFGFSKSVKSLVKNKVEGSIDTGKMMRQLLLKAQYLGIESRTLSKVLSIDEAPNFVNIRVEGFAESLQAEQVVVCTNAFTKNLFPEEDVVPGRGQVLLTNKIPNLKLSGIFHMDAGYYYFRNIDGRILLGGGRNLDKKGETTTQFELNSKHSKPLRKIVARGNLSKYSFYYRTTLDRHHGFRFAEKTPYKTSESESTFGRKIRRNGRGYWE
jgi:gamma-glutamylputrescine oxidase